MVETIQLKATEHYFAVVLFSYTRWFLLWSLYKKKFFSVIIQVNASIAAPSHSTDGSFSFLVSQKMKIAIFIEWFRSLRLEL